MTDPDPQTFTDRLVQKAQARALIDKIADGGEPPETREDRREAVRDLLTLLWPKDQDGAPR